ncbi:MvdC/MvdD family ATP grasp protein, partial [Actinomadura sp. LOL_011]
MSGPVVLMLAEQDDAEAVYVSDALTMRGARVAWFDTAWFPVRADMTVRLEADGWRGEITCPDGTVRLDDVMAVYYRQSQPFTFPDSLSACLKRILLLIFEG